MVIIVHQLLCMALIVHPFLRNFAQIKKHMWFKKKYAVRVEDCSRLMSLMAFRMPLWRWMLLALTFILLCIGLAVMLVCFTPMRQVLSGYVKESQRALTIDNLMRLDSLRDAYEENMLYMNNLFTVLDTDRVPGDSTGIVVNEHQLTPDSLLPTSTLEQNFVKKIQEREKYNISVLAPLAAEGMIFAPVAEGAYVTDAYHDSHKVVITIPNNSHVAAISDGIVIDCRFLPSEKAYTLLIQHDKGFLSRYSGIGRLLVQSGDRVSSGEAVGISAAGDARGNGRIALEMWHNGEPLFPWEFLSKAVKRGVSQETEEGRGRL